MRKLLTAAMMLLLSIGAWAQHEYYDKALAAYKEGNLDLAMQYLQKQCSEAECDFASQWLGMEIFYSAQEYQLAGQIAEKLLPQLKKDAHESRCTVYAYMAVAAFENEDYKTANKLLTNALKEDPKSSYCYYERAYTSVAQEHYDAAIKDLKKSIEFEPDRIEAYTLAGLCYEAKKDTVNMHKCYQTAIEKTNGETPWVWCEYGATYFNRGQLDRAIDMLFKAITLDSENARTGRFYNFLQKHDAVLLKDRLKAKVEEEPWNPTWEALLGDSYETIDSLPEAYMHYRIASLQDATYDGGVQPLRRLAQALADADDYEGALLLLEEGLEVNPMFLPYRRLKHAYTYNKGDYAQALEEAERLMDIDEKQKDDLMFLTADYLCKLGRYEEAMVRCLEILKTRDEYNNLTLLMAELYRKMGKTAEAESNYRILIKQAEDYFDYATMTPKPITKETADRLGSFSLPRSLMGIGLQDKAQEVVRIMNGKISTALNENPDLQLDATLLYNLACVNAVVGMHSDAISMLELADKFGHSQPRYTLVDPDFESIRNSQDAEVKEQWQKLIDKMTEAQRVKAKRIHEAIDGVKLTEKQRIIKK